MATTLFHPTIKTPIQPSSHNTIQASSHPISQPTIQGHPTIQPSSHPAHAEMKLHRRRCRRRRRRCRRHRRRLRRRCHRRCRRRRAHICLRGRRKKRSLYRNARIALCGRAIRARASVVAAIPATSAYARYSRKWNAASLVLGFAPKQDINNETNASLLSQAPTAIIVPRTTHYVGGARSRFQAPLGWKILCCLPLPCKLPGFAPKPQECKCLVSCFHTVAQRLPPPLL